MSVPVNERTQGKLEACVKAHDLTCYTLNITANKNVFAADYQRAITDKINETALDIWTKVWTANNILVKGKEEMEERLRLQEAAARDCNNLLSLIEIAAKLFHLRSKRVAYWTSKTVETRNLIRAWRESDRKRYSAKINNGV